MKADLEKGTKVCSKCKVEQPLGNFYRDKHIKIDGLVRWCINCSKVLYRLKHPPRPVAQEGFKVCTRCKLELPVSNFIKSNSINSNKDGLRGQCKACLKQYREEHAEYYSQYRQEHKEECREYHKLYRREITKVNLLERLKSNMRVRIGNAVRLQSMKKTTKFAQYIGCTLEELKVHLESQFTEGMTWEDYGRGLHKWNIDHIIPLNSATNEEELFKLCHYTNLQPLWFIDNVRKGNKILC